MEGFKLFFEQTKEQEKDIKASLGRIPKKFTQLIKGYEIKWTCDNVLGNGDTEHIGIINPNTKTITVSAPYRYSREFTFLHELAHKVWQKFVAPYPKLLKKWKDIVKNTKNKMNQNDEEIFCHGFAACYAKNPPTIHYHPEWIAFIKDLL